MKLETAILHHKWQEDFKGQVMSPPIVQSSTFSCESILNRRKYAYGRAGNPSRNYLEDKIKILEDGEYCSCFASGVAAIHSVLSLLSSNDEVIISPKSYSGTLRILNSLEKQYGVRVKLVDFNNLKDLRRAISTSTKLVWIETPTNPVLEVFDITRIKSLCNNEVLVAVDNTFATPIFQKPLSLGADITIHSCSKYLGGHSDALLGAVITNDLSIANKVKFFQNAYGGIPAPFECFLVERGIKTLSLRMAKHESNAKEIYNLLMNHKMVRKVNYPIIDENIQKQMLGSGGVISFDLHNDSQEKAIELVEKLEYFRIAESLGGVESLVTIPSVVSMKEVSVESRYKNGVSDSLIRLSIGIEAIEDLIIDLTQALK